MLQLSWAPLGVWSCDIRGMFHLVDGIHCQWSRNSDNGDRILSSTALIMETVMQAVKCNLDPSKIAGPLETAFQDIVGQSFLLGVGYLVFNSFESFKSP